MTTKYYMGNSWEEPSMSKFKIGDRVRIIRGPYRLHIGTICNINILRTPNPISVSFITFAAAYSEDELELDLVELPVPPNLLDTYKARAEKAEAELKLARVKLNSLKATIKILAEDSEFMGRSI